ncbi:hypothetical protein [Zavarzinella formosa]|uniref:hypothetical protein n=1 Tax=Zavarzinella formosa TaxID=360055 RepID=UPI0002D2E2CE|nr:hypothetical protein [Zavarzinella formosa]
MKASSWLVLLVGVALPGSLFAEEDDAVKLRTAVERAAELEKQVAKVLSAVKDRASAENATAKLSELGKDLKSQLEACEKHAKAGGADAIKSLPEEKKNALIEGGRATHNEFTRISIIPDAIAVIEGLPYCINLAEDLEGETKVRAITIEKAVKIYAIRNDGVFPDTLAVVAKLIEGGKIPKDAWGRDFQYDPKRPRNAKADATSMRPDVWTTSPYGGGKKLIGNWK